MKEKELKKLIDKMDAEIMAWHYMVCEINFGAEGYAQDSTELREILKENLLTHN